MAGTKKPGKKIRVRPYVMVTYDVMDSKAYRELPASASKMLPYFMRKVKVAFWEKEYYQEEFSFPYAEAESKGCPRRTFAGVIKTLMKHGFIDPVKKGGLRSFVGLGTSMFKLSERWKAYGDITTLQEVRWESFGKDQIHRQGQKLHTTRAESEPKKS